MGMIECAEYIVRQIEKHKIVENHMSGGDLTQSGINSIVVTGHSLGAGVASILSLILHKKYQQFNVKCYAFSPPGGLLCPRANEEAKMIVTAILVGKDIIPRLGHSHFLYYDNYGL